VYAEDPLNNFLPDIGQLTTYNRPQGPGIRVDDGYEAGMTIPIYYDPMIAKLVAYGNTREEAIAKMIRAIEEYEITGVQTTLDFGKFVLQHDAFISGKFDTHFVKKYFSPEKLQLKSSDETTEIAAALAGILFDRVNNKMVHTNDISASKSKWKNRLQD
jgi:acetyl/propionyl-CoA carboxylase alpha subunit